MPKPYTELIGPGTAPFMNWLPLFGVLFMTPLAAAAVVGGAAAVPIIIHLLNRKRYIVINWAAMRFLIAAQKKNIRRLKLEQWLLLATRTLLVMLLALAMAAVMPWFEPVWQRLFPGASLSVPASGRTHRIIVIDASFTMATKRGDDRTRFEAAKIQAREVLDQSAPGDGYSLILLGSPVQVIVPGPVNDRDKMAREIDELKLPHGSADVAGALHAAGEIAAKSRDDNKYSRRDVYVIGDLRRSTWPMPAAVAKSTDAPTGGGGVAETWARLFESARVVAIDVAGKDVDNLAVTSLSISDTLPLVQMDLAISAVIHNHGRTAREDVPVTLLVGKAGERYAPVEIAQRLVTVPADSAVNVNFALEKQNRFRGAGQYIVQVRVGEDALRLDDSRWLALTVRDTIPVMVVNGKPSADPLDRASGFLAKALNPFPEGERSPESPADVRVLNPREFQDSGLGDLFRKGAPIEVVFLCDLPTIGSNEAGRLEAHLKRGGSVVIGLGPNASKNIDTYNRVLYNDGKGLLPGPLVGVRRAENGQHFSLAADEEAFKHPPLRAFRSESERSSFATPYFGRYIQLDIPANGPARRLFSFLPSNRNGKVDRLDPAVIEWPRHRGRVIVFASSLNADWNEWPRTLSFAPFIQELLRFSVAGASRQTLLAGEPIEEYVPGTLVGLSASIVREDGSTVATLPVATQDEAGLVRLPAADQAGVYRVGINGQHESVFAVNVPVVSPTGGAESDLRRLTSADFKSAAPDANIQVVGELSEVQNRLSSATIGEAGVLLPSEPRGPAVAKILLVIVVGLMLLETILAWRFGSARVGQAADPLRVKPSHWLTPLWAIPSIACLMLTGIVAHAAISGEFLGFLPTSLRRSLEQELLVPEAAPGEGTRWRLESIAYLTGDSGSDRWLMAALIAMAGVFVWRMYRLERPGPNATGPLAKWRSPLIRLGSLRFGLLVLALLVMLPQVKLAFEREGWPDVVVAIDDSASMGIVDTFQDPIIRRHAEELKEQWNAIAKPKIRALEERKDAIHREIANHPTSDDVARQREEVGRLQARIVDMKTPHRLNLIKAMLATGSGEWLKTLIQRRQMRVHIYRVSSQTTRMTDLNDPEQCQQLLDELVDVMPTGDSSQLGTGINSILKTFRGGSLNAIVLFTDGVTTRGEDIPSAARTAARADVPLFFVGIGNAAEPPDLSLSDLRAEDVVHVNDRLVMEAKISAQGPGMPDLVPVTLSEIRGGVPVELARESVRLDPLGKPVKVRFVHQPREAGEKTFVIEFPKSARIPNDVEPGNDRLEHRVFVAEAKRMRVLLVEGYPRYDYRYVKALFERESEAIRGNKSIDVDSLLLSADPEHPKQDKTSINRFPTLEELKKYDVVILGDVAPKQLTKSEAVLGSLVSFVKDHGGGLIMLAGEQSSPHAYRDTPLADIMPVIVEGLPPAVPAEAGGSAYRPKLTSAGQSHPMFRFTTEEQESVDIWNRLPPLMWYAKGYRRKLSAEVLAVHPEAAALAAPGSTAREENYPLILQQFVGTGRVLFLGFDDTWRWRLRQDELRFNQFWIQAVRSMARGRVGRTEVRTDRKTYRRDDPVRVSVRFPDDVPAPTEPVKVIVDRTPSNKGVARGERETQTIQLALKEGTRATFETLVTRTPEGDYSFTLSTPLPIGTPPRAEARILPPPGELDRIQLNEVDLQRAARESRGTYYPLDKADKLLEELPAGPRVALDQPCEPISIWNHSLLFALVLSLLTSEWLMRKKWRLL
ncbi:MAG: VWA domain-containing protein [Gemmataceae bacterium]|nr:VWA domain-containing protein [Gemmataceae bacterium]